MHVQLKPFWRGFRFGGGLAVFGVSKAGEIRAVLSLNRSAVFNSKSLTEPSMKEKEFLRPILFVSQCPSTKGYSRVSFVACQNSVALPATDGSRKLKSGRLHAVSISRS